QLRFAPFAYAGAPGDHRGTREFLVAFCASRRFGPVPPLGKLQARSGKRRCGSVCSRENGTAPCKSLNRKSRGPPETWIHEPGGHVSLPGRAVSRKRKRNT